MSDADSTPQTDESSTQNTLRRRIVQTFGGLGVISFAGALLTPLKTLGIAAEGGGETELEGQTLVLAERYQPQGSDETFDVGTPVTEEMMTSPDSILTYPQNLVDQNNFLVRLHRLEPEQITEPTNPDWTASGYVAYSAICTHLGCTVDWDDGPDTATGRPTDHCFCHGSQFDPYEGAKVVHPPAQRALPQVGITLADDGTVQLISGFEGKVGP